MLQYSIIIDITICTPNVNVNGKVDCGGAGVSIIYGMGSNGKCYKCVKLVVPLRVPPSNPVASLNMVEIGLDAAW